MPRNIPTALKDEYAKGTTHIVQCWRATLRDGTVITSTTHTKDLTISGVVYGAAASFTPSNVESTSDLSVDNMEVDGYLASPQISIDDVRSGRWDYASVVLFEVNANNVGQGINILRRGTLGSVKAGLTIFTAELRGLTQKYARRIVMLTTQECTADLGDARCKVDLTPWTVTGIVDSEEDNKVIFDAARTEPADFFTGGLLTWTTGLNAGTSMEVKAYSPGRIELFEAMPHVVRPDGSDPAPGPTEPDQYSMYAGCQKRFYQDCIGKFNNGINFRGFPHLPGVGVFGGPGTAMTPATVPSTYHQSPPPVTPGSPPPPGTPPPPPGPPGPPPPPSTGTWGTSAAGITLLSPDPFMYLATGANNDYWVDDDPWGTTGLTRGTYAGVDGFTYETGYGRLATPGPNGEGGWRSAWKFPNSTTAAGHEVKAYPSIIYGAKPGLYSTTNKPGGVANILNIDGTISNNIGGITPTSFLPIKASSTMRDITATWNYHHNVTPSGEGHFSFDIFWQNTPNQGNYFGNPPITHEIMIPLNYWGDYGAYSPPRRGQPYVGDVVLEGYLWHVFYAPYFAGGWRFIVFEPDSPTAVANPGSLNLTSFFRHIISRGWWNGDEYLCSIGLGVEPVYGIGDIECTGWRVY